MDGTSPACAKLRNKYQIKVEKWENQRMHLTFRVLNNRCVRKSQKKTQHTIFFNAILESIDLRKLLVLLDGNILKKIAQNPQQMKN
jgi:hypothetical protein